MDCLYLPLASAALSLLAQAPEVLSEQPRGISTEQYRGLAILAIVVIVPFLLGTQLARLLKLPSYATRLSLILLAVIGSVTVLSVGKIGLGVDLRGGTILVYEIDPSVGISDEAAADLDVVQTRVSSKDLIPSLSRRINPAGTQEIVIRPYGETQLEIIIPEVDQREVDRIKDVISRAGILRFSILANSRDHQRLIELARRQAEDPAPHIRMARTVMDTDGETVVGYWATVDQEETPNSGGIRPLRVDVAGSIIRDPADGRLVELPPQLAQMEHDARRAATVRWMRSEGMQNIQALMVVDELLDVTGEHLAYAARDIGRDGGWRVRFSLTDAGSRLFLALTTANAPEGAHQRQLGIVLDDRLLSAPSIRNPISGSGEISGNFTRDEVDELVRILEAGRLPAALTKMPISENQIDATLGADTIQKGLLAIVSSLVLVLIFALLYYRYIGVIACIALLLNLGLILAVMILIGQPLTLPGLAGLVLTVGMSIDANVLIFERIREELNKGAAARMAIRNGFGRATTTIIDANLTTLITAIVLYAIGTDQIRGFAVTLILGILFSMFTAIYMSRTFFDIAERRRLLSLSMSDLINRLRNLLTGGETFDFMRRGPAALAISSVLLIGGVAAIIARGGTLLDIDFAGGSSVTFRLQEPASTDDVRAVVDQSLRLEDGTQVDYTVNNVRMDGAPRGTVFKVDSSIPSADQLKDLLVRGIESEGSLQMVHLRMTRQADEPAPTQSRLDSATATTLVAARSQDDSDETPAEVEPDQGEDAQPEDQTEQTPASTADEPGDAETDSDDERSAAEQQDEGDQADAAAAAQPARPLQTILSRTRISLGIEGTDVPAQRSGKSLLDDIVNAADQADISLNPLSIELAPVGEGAEDWSRESDLRFSDWVIGLPLEGEDAEAVLENLQQQVASEPLWIGSSDVGSRVAGDMIQRAFAALFASLFCIIGYIWFRFQRVMYGLAAVAALMHDVLITLGAIAVSYWLAGAFGFLLIEPFKISLTVVAALLTVIGYSLNDTIVVFDRIRETKGKSPRLTSEMVNISITSTLSRTLLTSLTTLIVVGLLYVFGGDGIHAFAFSLVVGVLVGTYSSVFVASPILLWLISRYQPAPRAT